MLKYFSFYGAFTFEYTIPTIIKCVMVLKFSNNGQLLCQLRVHLSTPYYGLYRRRLYDIQWNDIMTEPDSDYECHQVKMI